MTRDRKASGSPERTDERLVRLSVNLNTETTEALEDLIAETDSTATEVMRRAIGALKFLSDAQRRGARVLIEEDGVVHEVVFLT
ncbi:hypothetical protein KIH74_27930 [Kineosporia sp. J2-2]|uniref:Ribbon-helix-helix protein CopG domain-containing protein n=1 Tax=Kineosporia corallincola TaxID=2835133 RepID=A0ABS5TNX6_9ACTN|nr:hypothetical protein [Kineosporia corallincola]MBT0772804.1 hypothetical protein [Kineosporia corallincola]